MQVIESCEIAEESTLIYENSHNEIGKLKVLINIIIPVLNIMLLLKV